MPTISASQLDRPYPLDAATVHRFQEDGFVRLPLTSGLRLRAGRW